MYVAGRPVTPHWMHQRQLWTRAGVPATGGGGGGGGGGETQEGPPGKGQTGRAERQEEDRWVEEDGRPQQVTRQE